MKLADVYSNRIVESLDNPLPFEQVSNNRFRIHLDDTNKIDVVVATTTVSGYVCTSILFVNPHASQGQEADLTNYFNGPGAIRVFSTLKTIISQLRFDLLIFVPDDSDIDVENTKTRLYMVLAKKAERLNLFAYSQKYNIPEFDKPIIVGFRGKATQLTDEQVKQIVIDFGLRKLAP